MGLLDKVESTLTLAILGIAGYVFLVNYNTIKELWCKIPGFCGISDCKLTANDCWNTVGPRSEVDIKTCTCTIPEKECKPSYIELATCKLAGHDWNYNPEVCQCDDYKIPTCQEVCNEFGKDCVNGVCVDPTPPDQPETFDSCTKKGGIWNSFTAECCIQGVDNAPCYCENPPGSGCYPYAESPGGEHCNINCNIRCSDSEGNYKPCDPPVDWCSEPCPQGQVRNPADCQCIGDPIGCELHIVHDGVDQWITLGEWTGDPGYWDSVILGNNGQCGTGE